MDNGTTLHKKTLRVKKFLRSVVPSSIWNRGANVRRSWITRDDKNLSAQEVFSRIYAKGLWGTDSEPTSGGGSHDDQIVGPYLAAIREWAASRGGKNLTAIDLGCGDFSVGSQIYDLFGSYIAIDVVPPLIDAHRQNDAYSEVDFRCLDATKDELPESDVIFVRQVLQHLSNNQVSNILQKLPKFRWAIVTEHIPADNQLREVNVDKPHGGGIRLKFKSGVYPEHPPFCLDAKSSRVILEVQAGRSLSKDGLIRTTEYSF